MLRIWGTIVFPWCIIVLAQLFYCYEYLLRILPSVMTEELRTLFGINGFTFGNLSAVYYYAYVPMQLPAGVLMDRFNTRKLLVFSCVMCGLGTYCFSQNNLYIAYLGRFLVGLGSAFAFLGVLKLATLWLPPSYFGFITGFTTSFGMIGAMVGNMTLTRLVKLMGTHNLLQIASVVGILLALLMASIIPNDQVAPLKKLKKEMTPITLKEFSERTVYLFKDLRLWILGTVGCLLFLSLTAFAEMWGIPYLIHTYHLQDQSAANYNSLVFLGWALGGPCMGALAGLFEKNSHRLYLISLNAFLGALIFSLILYAPKTIYPYLGILLFSFGLCSSSQIIIFSIVKEIYTSDISATAFALTNLLVMLGGAISQPLVGYILDQFSYRSPLSSLAHFSNQSFIYALSILPASFLIVSVLTVFMNTIQSKTFQKIN